VNQSQPLRRLNRMAGPDTGKNPPHCDAPTAPPTDEFEDSLDFLGENVQGDRGEATKDWPPPAGEEGVSNCADESEADDEEAFADKDPGF
jgi:hypothetical protein